MFNPISCNRIILPDDPFISPPNRVLLCDYEDALAVGSRRNAKIMPKVPKIVVDTAEDDDSSFSNDSDSPNKSKIFSQIHQVKFVKNGPEVSRSGDHLSKEEAEKCIEELKNIVADFEKCTLQYAIPKLETESRNSFDVIENNKMESSSTFNADLSSVSSDSEDSDSLVYEYKPLTTSLTDLPKEHHHANLIRVRSGCRHESLETIPSRDDIKTMKKFKSLNFGDGWSVRELKRNFENLGRKKSLVRSPKKLCEHNKLKVIDKHEPKSVNEACKRGGENALKDIASPTRIAIGSGKVAALTMHFSSLGDAGLIKFHDTPSKTRGTSEAFLNNCLRSDRCKIDAETQTSVRSSPNLSLTEAQVQTCESDRILKNSKNFPIAKKKLSIEHIRELGQYNYDYGLIYSLGLKKIGFSLDNLLGFPAERLGKINKSKSCPAIKPVEKNEEKKKKFPNDYIQKRKSNLLNEGGRLLNSKWSSDDGLLNSKSSKCSQDVFSAEGSSSRNY